MNIIFICTGNTCRSPMAKIIAEAEFKKAGIKASLFSAGVAVYTEAPASEHAINIAYENGLDLSGHISQPVTEDILLSADLALTMTNHHKSRLLNIYPDCSNKIFTICEYTGTNGDVSDPFGGDKQEYEECFGQLRGLIEKLAEKIKS